MILNDSQITAHAKTGMIEPFTGKIKTPLSSGLSSFGYDFKLSAVEIFINVPVLDEYGELEVVEIGDRHLWQKAEIQGGAFPYVVIPAQTVYLGVTVEKISIPSNCIGIALGKSTLARMGQITLVTPAEPKWAGHLTLEFFNALHNPIRLPLDQGIIQMIFLQGNEPLHGYGNSGKYQNQKPEVTFARG